MRAAYGMSIVVGVLWGVFARFVGGWSLLDWQLWAGLAIVGAALVAGGSPDKEQSR